MSTAAPAARPDGEQSETTLRRGVGILFVLGSAEARRNTGLGVVRIAELLGREKTQVSRTLKTLVDCDVVERDPKSLLYRLSWQLFALADRAGDSRLLETSGPVVERLVARLGEAAHVSVLRGADVLTVVSRASPQVVAATGWVGRTVPAYCTSSGRALLLDHADDDLRLLFADVTFAPRATRTPSDVDDLIARVARARRQGYAVVKDELERGLSGVAAPVRDGSGRIVAAVNVSAPTFRLPAVAGRELLAATAELSRLLGAPAERG